MSEGQANERAERARLRALRKEHPNDAAAQIFAARGRVASRAGVAAEGSRSCSFDPRERGSGLATQN